jgi:hypothetical protein
LLFEVFTFRGAVCKRACKPTRFLCQCAIKSHFFSKTAATVSQPFD